MNLLALPCTLRKRGVIGMNQRNFELVGACNDRKAYPLVDNKLFTKRLAAKAGIPMPELLGELSRQFEVEKISERIGELDKFVIKPAQGSGGRGILVIHGRKDGHYLKSSGDVVTTAQLKRLLSNIISGLYSLGGRADSAIIESLVVASEMFAQISIGGVPDIRVVVFRGYPIMAMLRLGTLNSEGKANLHQGGIGVGLDLRTGTGLGAVQYNRRITHHPDSGVPLDGIHIPEWKSLLALACRCYDATNLGYLGCDIVIDAEAGPLLLEMNARPGLAIQLANDCGLAPRLHAVRTRVAFAPSVDERVAFALDALGGAVA